MSVNTPFPWKAVRFGKIWTVENDAGDPADEYDVLEDPTEDEAHQIAAVGEMLDACKATAAMYPVRRPDPGGPDYLECPGCLSRRPGIDFPGRLDNDWMALGEIDHADDCAVVLARVALAKVAARRGAVAAD